MVALAFILNLLFWLLVPIYLGRAAAQRSFRIFVPSKGSYWRHKEKGFTIRVDTTACDVWYGYVRDRQNLYASAHRSMSVREFYKTYKKTTKVEVEEELMKEEGLRALAAL